jgi:hypothetical protein
MSAYADEIATNLKEIVAFGVACNAPSPSSRTSLRTKMSPKPARAVLRSRRDCWKASVRWKIETGAF